MDFQVGPERLPTSATGMHSPDGGKSKFLNPGYNQYLKLKTYRSSYTLIELIAVLAIVLIVAGVVVTNTSRIPVFITLENTVQKIQYLFSRAQLMAVSQGRNISVSYSGKAFSVDSASPSDGDIAIPGTSSSGGISERIPEPVDVEFDSESPKYVFFPDGTGSGTAFNLTFKGHSYRIRISSLTGLALMEKTSAEDR